MTDQQQRTQTQTDPFDLSRAHALQVALGEEPTLQSGDALPPFFHQIYFWDPHAPAALGRDGHPKVGGFIPDLNLPKRMWAAGRLVFHRPLIAGTRAQRISTIESVTQKSGRSGPLAFVRIRHDIKQRGGLAVSDWQELVYRPDDTSLVAAPEAAPTDEEDRFEMAFDSTLLFRYSALTFNGHRIHYDETYAREVEGYDGLVVHGPLLAHLLMQLANFRVGGLNTFQYKAISPLLHHEKATFCWRAGKAWVRGPDGRLCMSADAT